MLLTVLLDLSSATRRSSSRGSTGQAGAVALSGADGSEAAAGAVGLNDGAAAAEEVVAGGSGKGAVNLGRDAVAGVGHDAGDLGRVGLGVREDTLGREVHGTSRAQVVSNCHVKLRRHRLPRPNRFEYVFLEVRCQGTQADSVESDLVLYSLC